ncbi:MAG: UDP-N-acetylmuramate--L-alanine ligase [Candidatus Moraniibacteriota bacterium]|nr:MAG: UDP-N-acetylmuramate--L-alanine ligase [Candidatus Moranbacteria bacterium]
MKIYIVGIGGAGTSALANVYHEKGHEVRGSDDGDGFYTKSLVEKGVKIYEEFSSKHITDDVDFVVYSTAIDNKNVEVACAIKKNIDTITYPEAIAQLTNKMCAICVCGTHGKTTTTALIGFAFEQTHVQPTVIVGSQVVGWTSGSHVFGDDYLVVEADEYQNKLSLYKPCHIILTNIDYDHPDFFENLRSYKDVFIQFINRVSCTGIVVACGDEKNVRDVIVQSKVHNVIYYGTEGNNDYRIIKRECGEDGQTVFVKKKNGEEFTFYISLHGVHNAKNALAAYIVGTEIAHDEKKVIAGLKRCRGTARRFERRGTLNGAVLVDDYAHHPIEIAATLRTAREVFSNKRLTVAFHPHTFTRTEALLEEFVDALKVADEIIVLDIYGSAREQKGKITAKDLVIKINECGEGKAQHIAEITELAQWMKENLCEDDVFCTLGAGDIWQVYDIIITK